MARDMPGSSGCVCGEATGGFHEYFCTYGSINVTAKRGQEAKTAEIKGDCGELGLA
jgi:hypothetical protein